MTALSRRPLLAIALMFVITRLAVVAAGTWANVSLPANEGDEFKHLLDGGPALDMWYRWDAGFYATIATDGYRWYNERRPDGDMAFLPLYPLAVRGVMAASGCGFSPYLSTCATVAGLLVSNVALLAGCLALYALALPHIGPRGALAAVLLLLVAPGTIFFSSIYTEALFLLLTLLTFLALSRGQFLWAVVCACLAALTRSVGIALVPALLWAAWESSEEGTGARWRAFARSWQPYAALLPLAAFGGYILWAGSYVGQPLAYFSSYEIVWQRDVSRPPWETLLAYFSGQPVSLWGFDPAWIDLAAFVISLTLTIVVLRRERAWGLFALGAVALPLLSGTLLAMPRFMAVLFPLYIVVGAWAAARSYRLGMLVLLSSLLALLFIIRFVTWRWIA